MRMTSRGAVQADGRAILCTTVAQAVRQEAEAEADSAITEILFHKLVGAPRPTADPPLLFGR